MSQQQPNRGFSLARAIRKFFVSGFVVVSFVAYALHERFGNPGRTPGALAPPSAAQVLATAAPTTQLALVPTLVPTLAPTDQPTDQPTSVPTDQPTSVPTDQPTPVPTDQPTSAPAARGGLKDGAFSGDSADAYYGPLQVKAVIQSGKLADVQIVAYPNDRRTSIRINSIALPYLIQEAIQAQSAEVDLISGATLTSEAFIQSLQSALDSAKS